VVRWGLRPSLLFSLLGVGLLVVVGVIRCEGASIGRNLNVLYMAADHHAYIAVHQFNLLKSKHK